MKDAKQEPDHECMESRLQPVGGSQPHSRARNSFHINIFFIRVIRAIRGKIAGDFCNWLSDFGLRRSLQPEKTGRAADRVRKWAGRAGDIGERAADRWAGLQIEGRIVPAQNYSVTRALECQWNRSNRPGIARHRGKGKTHFQIIHQHSCAQAAVLAETVRADGHWCLRIRSDSRGIGLGGGIDPQRCRRGIEIVSRDHCVGGVR